MTADRLVCRVVCLVVLPGWCGVSLYKILFHFKALLWESIIVLPPPHPTCKAYPAAILLHDHCAIYAPPPTPPLYAIHHTILVMAISCKGQVRWWTRWPSWRARCAEVGGEPIVAP